MPCPCSVKSSHVVPLVGPVVSLPLHSSLGCDSAGRFKPCIISCNQVPGTVQTCLCPCRGSCPVPPHSYECIIPQHTLEHRQNALACMWLTDRVSPMHPLFIADLVWAVQGFVEESAAAAWSRVQQVVCWLSLYACSHASSFQPAPRICLIRQHPMCRRWNCQTLVSEFRKCPPARC